MFRKYSFLGLIFLVYLFSGCATNSDLRLLRMETDSKMSALEEKTAELQKETAALRKEVEKTSESTVDLRKAEAEKQADLTDIQDQIRQLKGQTDLLKKDYSSLQNSPNELRRDFKDRLENLHFKVSYIENFLGISKKDERPDAVDKGAKNSTKNGAAKGKGDKEALYAQAYDSFKDGKYEKARTEFQHFLKSYPDTEYSSNAQFWIGECYYFEKKYEKAILEYEKVIKNYPEGNKVPYALLKQGLSFLNLGDKPSAKAILQNIIKDYPNTNQARIARSKLLEIK